MKKQLILQITVCLVTIFLFFQFLNIRPNPKHPNLSNSSEIAVSNAAYAKVVGSMIKKKWHPIVPDFAKHMSLVLFVGKNGRIQSIRSFSNEESPDEDLLEKVIANASPFPSRDDELSMTVDFDFKQQSVYCNILPKDLIYAHMDAAAGEGIKRMRVLPLQTKEER